MIEEYIFSYAYCFVMKHLSDLLYIQKYFVNSLSRPMNRLH